MKSGVICCVAWFCVSFIEAPGFGLSLVISCLTSLSWLSVRFMACCILSHFLCMKSWKCCSITSCAMMRGSVAVLRSNCSSRHSCRSWAPIPGGSNSCSTATTLSISSAVASMLWYMASSSERVSLSFLSSPSLSSEPIRYSITAFWSSERSSSIICSFSRS